MEVITTHINADFDAFASMIAAKKLFPNAQLVFSGGEEKTLREFFITSSMYSLDIEALKSVDVSEITRLIIVDTRQRGRIGKFAQIVDDPEVEIHLFDHHPDSDDDIRGNFELVEKSGSCVAMMIRLIQERNIEITGPEATIMALGIYEDTGSLTFSSTTPGDYRAAAVLLESGAHLSTIADIMARTLTSEQILVLADLIKNTRQIEVRGIKIIITEASVKNFTDELAVCVNRMKEIENRDVVFALIRLEGRVHLIGRSDNELIDVSQIAAHFGGGGHPYAAAATIKDMTLIQAREALHGYLLSTLRTSRTASEIMSYPVRTMAHDATVEEARHLMTIYNVNVLPIIKGGEPIGFVTRQTMERAAHHDLKDRPVHDFETGDLLTADPDTPFNRLYEIVVGGKQRLVPVMEKGEMIGVVTRTDILNNLLDERTLMAVGENGDAGVRPAHVRDLGSMLSKRLPGHLLKAIKTIGALAKENQMSAFLVGGFVRDLILRLPNLDLDVVVEGNAMELAKKAVSVLGGRVKYHEEFKTAVLVLPDNTKIDMATARTEYYEYPAALPVIESSSIKLDLYRRDFTINTLVLNLSPDRFGEMVDFFGAYQDIKDRHIRVLHNLSFIEDPTRIMRAVRFEVRFSFNMGRHTKKLLTGAVDSGFLSRVAGRRIFHELRLSFDEAEPNNILKELRDLGVLETLHQKLRLQGKQEALIDEVAGVLTWHELLFTERKIQPWKVWMFALVGYLPNNDIQELFNRLDLDPRHGYELILEKRKAEEVLYSLGRPGEIKYSEIYRQCGRVRTESLLYIMAKTTQDRPRKSMSFYLTHLCYIKPETTGNDLVALGITPGPIYRRILDALLYARLDKEVKNKEQELAFVHEQFSADIPS